jgi:hypothetical protein
MSDPSRNSKLVHHNIEGQEAHMVKIQGDDHANKSRPKACLYVDLKQNFELKGSYYVYCS